MTETRKLAAIMFTDIVGYSALMSKDEKKAMRVLEKNRVIHLAALDRYNGRFIKEIGDGTLSIFHSSFDAVTCALKIRKACCAEKDLEVRIGIHIGDIIFKDNDVFGDGVNIAARIEAAGKISGIYVSGRVYEDIKNKEGIIAEFVGEKMLKNIDHPVKIYSVSTELHEKDLIKPTPEERVKPIDKSIIVLPFTNLSPDPEQEYFSDGLTEEIITDLSFIHNLLVISRNSATTFKGTKKTTKEIANRVGVQYVLEGSVRKSGNNLRIVAQLIDASRDVHLWAEKYSGTLDDIFDIQEKVSRSIVDALKIKLSENEESKISKRPVSDTKVYEQYLLARHKIWLANKESLSQGIELLNSSLKTFGRNEYLLVALGTAYFQYVNLGIDPDIKYLDLAEELIDEALVSNPEFSKGYYIKSAIHETKGELKEAFRSVKRAVEFDPADSEALMMLAFLYAMVGRPWEGETFARQAVETDPLNPLAYCGEWWIYQSAGKFGKTAEICGKMYRLDKDNQLSTWSFANALAYNNRKGEATSLFDSMATKYPDDFYSKLGKAQRHAINNEKQKALDSITEHVEKAAEMDHLWAWILADVCSLIGEKERAIDYLERATRDIFIDYPFFSSYDPFLENIRGEERFIRLMEKVKKKWEEFEV